MAFVFEIQDRPGNVSFLLRDESTQNLVYRGKTYTTLKNAKRGMLSIMRNAPIAGLEILARGEMPLCPCPKFQVFLSPFEDAYLYHLKARNGEIILSGEPQDTLDDSLQAIATLRQQVSTASWRFIGS